MKLLAEYIEELVLERLYGGFDIRHFKSLTDPEDIWDYVADSGLKPLGSGSGRSAYLLSSGKVLKVSRNLEGAGQTQDEWEGFQHFGRTGMVARVFEVEPTNFWWIIMEPVRAYQSEGQLRAETGLDDDMLQTLSMQMYGETPTKQGFKNYLAKVKKSWQSFPPDRKVFKIRLEKLANLTPAGMELLYKLFILTVKYNIDDIARFDHWGKTADGRIVCLDYGYPAKFD